MKSLLRLGVLAPLLFWIALITGGLIHGHYDHFRDTVSQAGALGSASSLFMSIAEILIGIVCLLFCVGAVVACNRQKIHVVPVITMLAMPVSIVWAACFPMGNPHHGDLGPIPLLIPLGTLWALFAWKASIRIWAILSFVLMCGIFLRFVPTVNDPLPGLVQRIFYLGWSIWSWSMSRYLLDEVIPSSSSLPGSPAQRARFAR